jgi:uncharacterized protein (DUF983 family)
MEQQAQNARLRVVIGRGLRRRCPHCGRGALFEKGVTLHARCAWCGLHYLRNQGDPWAFLMITDRLFFLIPPIAALFFGWLPRDVPSLLVLFGGLAVLFVATMPNRYGLCVALDYLTRRHWGDASDVLPPIPEQPVP